MPNYFAPAFQVQVDGTELAADVSKNIQQISVDLREDMIDTFSFTLANAYPALRWTHTSDADLFNETSSVRIALGYVDGLQELISGEITKISPTFPDSGMPTVSITGYTLLHCLSGDKKTRAFPKMTDKQIVEQIAGEAGLQAQADETEIVYDSVPQSNQTDLEFVSARAKRIHFEVLVRQKMLFFRKPPEESAKVYTLVWGHTQAAFSDSANKLPLKNFNTDLNIMDQVTGVTVRGYDPVSKKAIIGRAASTGAPIASTRCNRPREFVQVNIPVVSQAEADQHARAIYQDKVNKLINGHGTTLGIPDLKSGSVVRLEGLGKRFSGFYYVSDATHSIGGSGYSTNFSGRWVPDAQQTG